MQRHCVPVMPVAVALGFLSMAIAFPTAQAPQGGPAGAPGGAGQARGGGRGPQTPPLLMTTTAWEDGGVIPDKYTQAAGPMAVSPELKWAQVPPGTQSFVLLLHDPEPVLNKGSKMDITLADLNIGDVTGSRKRLPRANGVAADRSVFGATGTWVLAPRRARIITTRSNCMRSTRNSTSRRARRNKPPTPDRRL